MTIIVHLFDKPVVSSSVFDIRFVPLKKQERERESRLNIKRVTIFKILFVPVCTSGVWEFILRLKSILIRFRWFVAERKLREEVGRLELDNVYDAGLVEAIVDEQKAVGDGR